MALTPEPMSQFPWWPMNCLTFYRNVANDYGRYMQALGAANDPAQTARAEEDYGVFLAHDLMRAWYDLAVSPLAAVAEVMTSGASPSPDGQSPSKTKSAKPSA